MLTLYQVIEYLMKKGYSRTEAMLRTESSNVDREGKPIRDRAEDFGGEKFNKAFQLLSAWVDQSLDIYKVGFHMLGEVQALTMNPLTVRAAKNPMANFHLLLS